MTRWLGWAYTFALVTLISCPTHSQVPPAAAKQYQRTLTREARALFGLDAPVAAMAAQIQQESAWRPEARSAYASGLAQFTPATAEWISGAYRQDLGENQPLNPQWAIRALVRYDYDLHTKYTWAKDECSRWAFVLSAYNGGPGWVPRDRGLCRVAGGCDDRAWFGAVEAHTSRHPAAAAENRGYPKRILLLYQGLYSPLWSRSVQCSRPMPSGSP